MSKFLAFLRKDIQIALSYRFNLLLQLILITFIISLIFFSLVANNDAGLGDSNFLRS